MSLIPPIYNRTQGDIDELKVNRQIGYQNLSGVKQIKWVSGLIGSLNAKDLNRIEANLQTIADLLDIDDLLFKTDWDYTDVVRMVDELRIISNLKKIEERYIFETERKEIKLPLNHYEKINAIEKLISEMYEALLEQYNKENFKTSDGQNFVPLDSTGMVVSGGTGTVGFETNDGEIFETNDREIFLSNEKIIVK